jgi:cytochrome c oxidase subunit 3
MATLSSPVTIDDRAAKDPNAGYGRGGAPPPVVGGGGGDRGGNGSPDYGQRLRRTRLGLLVGLVSSTMIFVSFTSVYIMRRGLPTLDDSTGGYVRDWLQVNLPTGLLLMNTLLLLLSSITVELARRQIARQAALAPVQSIPGVCIANERNVPWLGATVALGLAFLIGQWMAWRELAARGFYLATSPSSSMVYLLTGTHAVHLAGGLLVLLYATATGFLHRSVEGRRIVVDVTAWYWHFMAFVWIYIFALLEFVR